jgi:hypothetical protein
MHDGAVFIEPRLIAAKQKRKGNEVIRCPFLHASERGG